MIASARFLKHTAQPPRRLPPIPLPQREEHRSLTIPPNTIPNSVLIPIHDLEPGNRAMKVTENSENLSSEGSLCDPYPGTSASCRRCRITLLVSFISLI